MSLSLHLFHLYLFSPGFVFSLPPVLSKLPPSLQRFPFHLKTSEVLQTAAAASASEHSDANDASSLEYYLMCWIKILATAMSCYPLKMTCLMNASCYSNVSFNILFFPAHRLCVLMLRHQFEFFCLGCFSVSIFSAPSSISNSLGCCRTFNKSTLSIATAGTQGTRGRLIKRVGSVAKVAPSQRCVTEYRPLH